MLQHLCSVPSVTGSRNKYSMRMASQYSLLSIIIATIPYHTTTESSNLQSHSVDSDVYGQMSQSVLDFFQFTARCAFIASNQGLLVIASTALDTSTHLSKVAGLSWRLNRFIRLKPMWLSQRFSRFTCVWSRSCFY